MAVNKTLQPIKQRFNVVGNAPGLDHAIDIAVRVAPTDLSVLILGENGVGKEVLPRIIHEYSSRKHESFIAINCGSIPEGTIDSELFGHEKGAYTGAISDHEGFFGTANKGTLFLDEVGELPLSTQVRLLRVLETGEYMRVGSSTVRHTNVRIVAATNVHMEKAISEGRFREDLFYRLGTIPIHMPPLRERGDDIHLLFRKFAADMAEKYCLEPISLTPDAVRLLTSYKWPGNIRQLKNITENLSIIAPNRLITSEDLRNVGITDDGQNEGALVTTQSHHSNSHSFEQELKVLLQQIFKLRQEMDELRNYVDSALQHGLSITSTSMPITHTGLHEGETSSPQLYDGHDYEPFHDAEEVIEPVHMTMQEKEREAIADALVRHNNNRKLAANELGMSERTIYRKIKNYNLDPNA